MSRNWLATALLLGLICAGAGQVFAEDVFSIVTGPKTGTYYAFGKDIAQVASKAGIHIDVKASQGSIDNIKRINGSEHIALGIVQSDVLGFLARSKSPDSIKMAGNLRLVFPFYNEEVHVLARKDIKSFAELKDKKVAIGEEGSGNMLTAINLFSMMNVTPGEMKKISPAQGVVSVLKGELDAVVFVGGKPVRLFKNLEDLTLPENEKYAAMLEQVHFLPMDNARMLEEYRPATISHADYNFVPDTVPTIAVQAVLVSYDFSKGDKARCAALGNLVRVMHSAMPSLKEKGHPKWKEVNLDAKSGVWKKDSCAWPDEAVKAEEDKSKLMDILEKGK